MNKKVPSHQAPYSRLAGTSFMQNFSPSLKSVRATFRAAQFQTNTRLFSIFQGLFNPVDNDGDHEPLYRPRNVK